MAEQVVSKSVHYSTDDTAPICGAKSKVVSHYLSEISCLKCALMLRNIGLVWQPKKKGVKRAQSRRQSTTR